ncbi:mitotic checkpoint serine/threonine-protein kinase BUB1 isoform 2-T2 [Pholidichthys leucotaenia]
MDVAACLQRFEESLSSYSGDDPLDPWDKFVGDLEGRLPADDNSGMSLVFDTLVQRFLNVERYANDVRYVNFCIKCASYYADPIALYRHIFRKGIGTRTAALYVAWARQFEQRGMNEQVDALYQKALENQAQPAHMVHYEYRQFQIRIRSEAALTGVRNPLQNSNLTNQMSSHRELLPPSKASVDEPSEAPRNTIIIVSRSETSGKIPSSQNANVQTVSAYAKDALVCEGSELCFEEVRAEKYLRKRHEREQREQDTTMFDVKHFMEDMFQHQNNFRRTDQTASSQRLPIIETATTVNPDPTQQPFGGPRPSSRLSSRWSHGLRLLTEPLFIQEVATSAAVLEPEPEPHQQERNTVTANVTMASSEVSHHPSVSGEAAVTPAPTDEGEDSVFQAPMDQRLPSFEQKQLHHLDATSNVLHQDARVPLSTSVNRPPLDAIHQDAARPAEPEEILDVSQGGTANLSHITPNSSLGYVQATPSRVLPSPTVNTREALGVIMDMFQAPTFLDGPVGNLSVCHTAEKHSDAESSRNGDIPVVKPAVATPFTIFQDENTGNYSVAAAAAPPAVAVKSKPFRPLSEILVSKADKTNDSPSDLIPDESTTWGACYNNSLAACPNSTTDFAMLAQFVSTPFTGKTSFGGIFFQDQENKCDDDAYMRRQPKKLSPILEQSPSDENVCETAVGQMVPSSMQHGTIVGEALPAAHHSIASSSTTTMVQPPPSAVLSFRDHTSCPPGPSWEVYADPEPLPKPSSHISKSETFAVFEDVDKPASPERVQNQSCDVPMSPECALKPDWLEAIRSPEAPNELDMDALLSPCRSRKMDATHIENPDIPMSPQQQPQACADVPMSPAPLNVADEPMTSPDREPRPNAADVSMSRMVRNGGVQLISDPWDSELISSLMSSLSPPLTAHPHCIRWSCGIPNISPKMVLRMGSESLTVDCVLGEGAFAKVFQATNPVSLEKMVLKVQKPANPWEFYIHTQLDARLQPDQRRLYGNMSSAHLFTNGSVLLGELHCQGTLLNVVNIYRTLSDKVVPQPLVMYFAICILLIVERLHAIHIIHADIKPDNFLLGGRFLENSCFDPESTDHGLVLVDLGQSIDMELFPQGTAFTTKCLTSGFQCTEMLSGSAWNYQTDYFGIAGTVHCLLFGSYMQVINDGGVWRTDGVFRRNPHSDLWLDFFHTLLNVPSCDSLPCLRSLRQKLSLVLEQNYSTKLPTLKRRLVVQLLERKGVRT